MNKYGAGWMRALPRPGQDRGILQARQLTQQFLRQLAGADDDDRVIRAAAGRTGFAMQGFGLSEARVVGVAQAVVALPIAIEILGLLRVEGGALQQTGRQIRRRDEVLAE